MHHDDEPLEAAVPSRDPAVASGASIDERLFEDILDLEGALRLTTQATAGIGAPRAQEIEALGWRVPEPAAARLLALSTEIRSATRDGNIAAVRKAQLGVIEALVTLRTSLWSRNSED